jgi:cytochrome c oxidase cbb3-type subunit 3
MKRAAILISFALLIACEREERGFRVEPPQADRINSKRMTTLQPGEPIPQQAVVNEYEENAYALGEGKRLFSQMNCTGCHANGGGAIGPALMDDKWIYGSQPDQIFATIVEGRPNGMPAVHGKLPDYQGWQLAAYVRSLSGQASKDAAPSREDAIQINAGLNAGERILSRGAIFVDNEWRQ